MLTLYPIIGALFAIACAMRWFPEDESVEDYISTVIVSFLHCALWPLVLLAWVMREIFEGKDE